MRFYSKGCCLHVGFVFSLSSLVLTLCGVIFVQMAISQTDDNITMLQELALTAGCRSLCENDYTFETDLTRCCNSPALVDCKEKQVCKEESLANKRELQSEQQQEMYVMLCVSAAFAGAIAVILFLKRKERRRRERQLLLNHELLNQRLLMIVQRMRMREIQQRTAEERAQLFQSFLHSDTEDNVCAICLNLFEAEKAIRLQCAHVFHSECLRKWLAVNETCPFCRLRAEP